MIDFDANVSNRLPAALHVAGRAVAPPAPAWMAVGLRGLARMTEEEREIALENIEALVLTAYGNGPTSALRGPGARDRARDVLIRLGWSEPAIFARVSPEELITRMRTAIAAAGLDPREHAGPAGPAGQAGPAGRAGQAGQPGGQGATRRP